MLGAGDAAVGTTDTTDASFDTDNGETVTAGSAFIGVMIGVALLAMVVLFAVYIVAMWLKPPASVDLLSVDPGPKQKMEWDDDIEWDADADV